MKDPLVNIIEDIFDSSTKLNRHCRRILTGRNKPLILQEIAITLLKNGTRSRRLIEEGSIELWIYKTANNYRFWNLDRGFVGRDNTKLDFSKLNVWEYQDHPDLFPECLDIFLTKGVSEKDQEIFFKHYREEHSEIFISFKMNLPISYVLKSLRMTLMLVRDHFNPKKNIKPTRNNKSTTIRRVGPHTDETKLKMSKAKESTPRLTCPKCKSQIIKGKFIQYGHGVDCQKSPDRYKKLGIRECPHCGKLGKGSNHSRYHFDNCKKNKKT